MQCLFISFRKKDLKKKRYNLRLFSRYE